MLDDSPVRTIGPKPPQGHHAPLTPEESREYHALVDLAADYWTLEEWYRYTDGQPCYGPPHNACAGVIRNAR